VNLPLESQPNTASERSWPLKSQSRKKKKGPFASNGVEKLKGVNDMPFPFQQLLILQEKTWE
jgi:hypothetical protein